MLRLLVSVLRLILWDDVCLETLGPCHPPSKYFSTPFHSHSHSPVTARLVTAGADSLSPPRVSPCHFHRYGSHVSPLSLSQVWFSRPTCHFHRYGSHVSPCHFHRYGSHASPSLFHRYGSHASPCHFHRYGSHVLPVTFTGMSPAPPPVTFTGMVPTW